MPFHEGLFSDIGGLLQQANPLLQQLGLVPQPSQAGVGQFVGPALDAATLAAVLAQSGGGGSAMQTVEQTGPGVLGFGGDTTFTREPDVSRRWVREVVVQDEELGMRVFKNMGRPVLYSGDLAACRRVERVARRASKARGRRRPR